MAHFELLVGGSFPTLPLASEMKLDPLMEQAAEQKTTWPVVYVVELEKLETAPMVPAGPCGPVAPVAPVAPANPCSPCGP
jgi:hypothetical protein